MQPSLKLPFTAETLLDALLESIICLDRDRRITFWSRGAQHIYEYSAEEAIGQPYAMLFPGGAEEAAAVLDPLVPQLLAGRRHNIDGWRRTRSGRRVYVRVVVAALRGASGEPTGFVSHAVDITGQKQAEEALLRVQQETVAQSARYETLLEAQSRADIGIFVIEEGRIVFTNEAMCRAFGYTMEEMKALPSYLELAHPVDRERIAENHRRRLKGEQFPNRYDIAIITKSGERREAEITASPIVTDGRPGVLVVMVDNTERKRAEARVQYLALHDALTGLANRALFFDRLNAAIAAAHRKGGAFALLYLDLDDFKPINDLYGHEAGDRALRAVAERLNDCVRESDTVARIGGDEFALLLPACDLGAALACAERLRGAVAANVFAQPPLPQLTRLSVSIGVAANPTTRAESAQALVEAADRALYMAKAAGRNCVRGCDGSGRDAAGSKSATACCNASSLLG